MKPTHYTFCDLELNQHPDGAKIIQIGACVLDIRSGLIVDKLSVIVNPNEQLVPFIIQLTKITQEDVDGGVTLIDAFEKLAELHRKYPSFVNMGQWGVGDKNHIVKELKDHHNYVVPPGLFGRRDIDVKTLYVGYRIANDLPPSGGLSRAANTLGVKWVGQAHNALDDSINTANVFVNLINRLR